MADPRSRFTFDLQSGRYRSRVTGRFVPRAEVRRAIDDALASAGGRAEALAEQLRTRAIPLAEFELGMRALVKDVQLYSASAALGGWDRLTPADLGRVGARVREQYGYLRGFARAVADGTQKLDGTLATRAALYAKAGRRTYHLTERDAMQRRAFDEERSVLHPADHRGTCVSQAELSWQPIGRMVPVGERECGNNDRCSVEYRNSATGEVAA